MVYHPRMNLLWPIVLAAVVVGTVGATYVFVSWRSHRLPGRPYSYADCAEGRITSDAPRVVLLGDSLTHGTMSHSWLADLQKEYDGAYTFINQGWNGDLAWNALQKIDQVVACDPAVVGIFIGGNDALASFSPVWSESFVQNKQLPLVPTADWYRQNLEAIVERLQADTNATLVLFTLTMYGEDLNSPEVARFRDYSLIVDETAEKYDLSVLSIHQKMTEFIATNQKDVQSCSPADWPAYRAQIKWSIIRYHFFFQSWDQISASRGYAAQTDCVHLNGHSAGVIAQTFKQWLDDLGG